MPQGESTPHSSSQRLRRVLSNPWGWLVTGWLVALGLGFIGLQIYAANSGNPAELLDLVYLLLQLITLESGALQRPIPWQLEIARFALPALAAWTLLRTAMTLFREQAARLSLQFWNNHIIICGFGQKGATLAANLLNQGQRVVVIEQNPQADGLHAIRSKGAVVLIGDATQAIFLRQAGLAKASSLVSLLGKDRLNAEVATRAGDLLSNSERRPLGCFLHIVDPDLWDLLRTWEFSVLSLPEIQLELFNIYQRGAVQLVSDRLQVAGRLGRDQQANYVVIVGLGNLGQHLVVQIAERCFRQNIPSDALQLILIDPQVNAILAALDTRYPQIARSVSIIAHEFDVKSAEFLKGMYLENIPNPDAIADIYICLDDDSLVLSTALNVRRHLAGVNADIVMRVLNSSAMSPLIQASTTQLTDPPNLVLFPLVERTCTGEILTSGTNERLAQALHQNYVKSKQSKATQESQLPDWSDLSPELKNTNRSQADNLARILARAGFSLTLLRDWADPPIEFIESEIELLARKEHERWCDEKRKNGWRFAPAPKSERARTHPDLLNWKELSEASRETNRAAIRAIPALLHEAGFNIQPATESVISAGR